MGYWAEGWMDVRSNSALGGFVPVGPISSPPCLAQYQLQQTMWCSGGVEEEEDILEDQCGVKYSEVHIYSKSLLLLECFGGEREPAMRVSPSRNLLERDMHN